MTNKEKAINQILHRLFHDNTNQIDLKMLIVQLSGHDNINLTEQEIIEIKQALKSENLCEVFFIASTEVLKLTTKGNEVVHKYKTYSDYLIYLKNEADIQLKKERFNKRIAVWTLIIAIIGVCATIVTSILSKL